MPRRSTSKPKRKKKWVKKTNWLELPADVTANILHRLGPIEIFESAQKVCIAWHKICKDPAMWRVIDMQKPGDLSSLPYLEQMCMRAIKRSQGQLVDIRIQFFGTDELIGYLARRKRARQLRHLQISRCYSSIIDSWSEFFKKAPLLETISLTFTEILKESVADAGRYCPLLKSFEYNLQGIKLAHQEIMVHEDDDFVTAIAQGMSQLRHLQLIGNNMTNKGLQAILDGCPQLESLDIRQCFNINLDSTCGKLCKERIKVLMFPSDSVEGHKVAEDHPALDVFQMFYYSFEF